MGSRLELHNELLTYAPNVYFQPPSGFKMIYPCIVYNKIPPSRWHANDKKYHKIQGYNIMVLDRNPDSTIADLIEADFDYCTIEQYYVVDNINHTTLNLYY